MVTAGHLPNEYQEAKKETYFQKSDVEAIVEHRREFSVLSRQLYSVFYTAYRLRFSITHT